MCLKKCNNSTTDRHNELKSLVKEIEDCEKKKNEITQNSWVYISDSENSMYEYLNVKIVNSQSRIFEIIKSL